MSRAMDRERLVARRQKILHKCIGAEGRQTGNNDAHDATKKWIHLRLDDSLKVRQYSGTVLSIEI